ncbi:hypothetical protein ATCVNEJV2_373R [Acanthocystis turfacea Chlorella virus NE-JV-2]|nr:hypothetical protein ATCVNEJV2_373R [Acanthocystis turfacea Chlorella virus NE-JV-2]
MRLSFAYPAIVIAGSVVTYFSRALVHAPGVYFTSDEISDKYGNTIKYQQYSMFRSLAHFAHRH